jgi:hypothetical protein
MNEREEAREKISLILIRKFMALLAQDKELFEADCDSLGLTPTGFSNHVADAILSLTWPDGSPMVVVTAKDQVPHPFVSKIDMARYDGWTKRAK